MKLLSLLAWLVFAVSSNALVAGTLDVRVLEERSSILVKRSRPKCSPVIGTASQRRREELSLIDGNATAFEKRINLPGRSMGVFYRRETPNMVPIVEENQEDLAANAQDMSTAILKSFSTLGPTEQYSTGTTGLSGCTTLYVISRTGVYATHWWENVSFAPDEEWRDPPTQTDAELFQNTVIDALTLGGTYHPRLDRTQIEDPYIRAYLIHPTQTWAETLNDVGYPTQWAAIRTAVGILVPTLQNAALWTDIPYTATDDTNVLLATVGTAGKNIFKYDPAHVLPSDATTHAAALWVEGQSTPYHDDQW